MIGIVFIIVFLLSIYVGSSYLLLRSKLSLCNGPFSFLQSVHLKTLQFGSLRLYCHESSSFRDPRKDTKDTAVFPLQKLAIELLDCLTSTKDVNDATYDLSKDLRRDKLLAQNSYTDLKVQLQGKGLRTTGDKFEMITRLLLNAIDPSISFDDT
jgi:hypothetical protein